MGGGVQRGGGISLESEEKGGNRGGGGGGGVDAGKGSGAFFGGEGSLIRCDLKTRKRCDFFSATQKIASDFSAISSAIFWQFFCDFCGKTCDLVLCDLKTQRFFCDCDFLGR